MTRSHLWVFVAQEFRYPTNRRFAYVMALVFSFVFFGALLTPDLIGIVAHLIVAALGLTGFVHFLRHIWRMIDEDGGIYW